MDGLGFNALCLRRKVGKTVTTAKKKGGGITMHKLKRRLEIYPYLQIALANSREQLKQYHSGEIREQVSNKIAALEREVYAIEQAIDKLDPVKGEIVKLRYLKRKKWDQISHETLYCQRQCHRIHRRALDEIALSIK